MYKNNQEQVVTLFYCIDTQLCFWKKRQIIHAARHLTENLTVTAYIREIAYYLLSYLDVAFVPLQHMAWKCNCALVKRRKWLLSQSCPSPTFVFRTGVGVQKSVFSWSVVVFLVFLLFWAWDKAYLHIIQYTYLHQCQIEFISETAT